METFQAEPWASSKCPCENISTHFHVFFSPQLSVWRSQLEEKVPVGMWVPPAAPQTCWAVGTHTWGPGRAAQLRISLLAVIHCQGRGIRLRRERNMQWLLALWWVRAAGFGAVHYADQVGLCKTSLFILPVKGKELCGARTVWGGDICSHTDGDN